jgi:predicted DNA-binding protein YlxM (UPF0122 family)
MFEKNLQLSELIDVYGELLSERQQRVLELYYNQDFSLGEIAEELGISRQGVRDSIKKAERELFFFEEKLSLAARESAVLEARERILTYPMEPALREAVESLVRAALGQSEESLS